MKTIAILFCCLFVQNAFAQQQTTVVYFDYGQSTITAVSAKTLDSITALKSELNGIELSGHCDSIGSHLYNDELSLQRVAAVKKYLAQQGVSTKLFGQGEGFGKRQPVNDNATLADRSLNRRVEISFSINQPLTKPGTSIVDTSSLVNRSLNRQVETSLSSQQPPTKLETQITDTSTKEGNNIRLDNLKFVGGRHLLLPSSEPVLRELLSVLQKYPGLSIGLEGHICCTYDMPDGLDWDTKTNNLSVNRAKYIYDYLVEQGISKDRLSYKGFGNRKPLVYPEKTTADAAANRRVEIKITKKDL